MIKEIKTYNLY